MAAQLEAEADLHVAKVHEGELRALLQVNSNSYPLTLAPPLTLPLYPPHTHPDPDPHPSPHTDH